jgi:cystathionine beta-lyase/cystathionine gamma-synthase
MGKTAARLVDALRLAGLVFSLAYLSTIISHPAKGSHWHLSKEQRAAAGISALQGFPPA